jgi:hypothetical protein
MPVVPTLRLFFLITDLCEGFYIPGKKSKKRKEKKRTKNSGE